MKITKETGLVLALSGALERASSCASGCRNKPENLDPSVEQWRQDLAILFRLRLAVPRCYDSRH
jgi:hypothetical protein